MQLISVPLLALLLRGSRSEDIPPIIPTCFVTRRDQDSLGAAGSCPEPAADWPRAEHGRGLGASSPLPAPRAAGGRGAFEQRLFKTKRSGDRCSRIRRVFPLESESLLPRFTP